MASQDGSVSRRSFLKRATTVSVGALASRGVYQALEEFGILRPASAYADTVTRPQEQYLVDRKSTRLNSSHRTISYAVFCLNEAATSEIYTLSLHAALPIYQALEEFGILRPASAYADTVTRPQEQYLVGNIGVILDNGVTVALPPIYNDVITAKLKSGRRWTTSALKTAQRRVENALGVVEQAYPATAAGLTVVVGWGLPYVCNYLPASLWQANLPVAQALSQQTGTTQHAV